MGLFLVIIILIAFRYCASRYGLLSFSALGCVGMAIYSMPAVIGLELPFWVTATTNNRFLVAVPIASQWSLLAAWLSFLIGLAIFRPKKNNKQSEFSLSIDTDRLIPIVRACAILCAANYLYVAVNDGPLYFLSARDDQLNDAITLLSKWFVLIGVVASLLIGSRAYTSFFLLFLGITFLGGDRTMVAIVTAAALVTLSCKVGGARALLSGPVILLLLTSVFIVFLGKPIYVSAKNYFLIGSFEHGTTIQDALLSFEPFLIFSHLSYAMDTELKINFFDFILSVLGNALIVPSAFGLSTNLYNETIQNSFSFNIDYGVAGSYLAHGWAVGGVIGIILFYLFYAACLAWCDAKLISYSGLRKVLITCSGAVLAFYAHRNGMDNLGSFMRQIIIAGLIVSFVATVLNLISRKRNLTAVGS